MKRSIVTTKAPAAIGPYSQAVEVNGVLYVSGQIPLDPETGVLVDDTKIERQTEQVICNIQAILEEAGYTLSQVVKTTCYLSSMDDFGAMNEVYARFFSDFRPARATVEVSRLPKNARFEMDVIAVK